MRRNFRGCRDWSILSSDKISPLSDQPGGPLSHLGILTRDSGSYLILTRSKEPYFLVKWKIRVRAPTELPVPRLPLKRAFTVYEYGVPGGTRFWLYSCFLVIPLADNKAVPSGWINPLSS
jgi:hypothetical protein